MKRWVSWIVLLSAVLWVAYGFVSPYHDAFNLDDFGQFPVLQGGRIKPIDTVARNALLFMNGKQNVRINQDKVLPDVWLLQAMVSPNITDTYPTFRIDHPDVLALIGHKLDDGHAYTFKQILPYVPMIEQQAELARKVEPNQRNAYQRALLLTYQRLMTYFQLKNSLQAEGWRSFDRELMSFQSTLYAGKPLMVAHADPNALSAQDRFVLDGLLVFYKKYQYLAQASFFSPIPPYQVGDEWQSMGSGLMGMFKSNVLSPAIISYAELLTAYQYQDSGRFNRAVSTYTDYLSKKFPEVMFRMKLETYFNRVAPFYQSMVLYLVVLLLVLVSWLKWPDVLGKTAFRLLLLAFLIHTVGLGLRMYLQGRPPVTNLYSSAVFVGWVAIVIGILLERIHKKGIGTMVSAIIGFLTLIIAHHLSIQGDTLEMMQAVLDSNFWLSTHVVTINMGYGGTFLMGILAHIYIFKSLLSPSFDETERKSLKSMVFGTACFAIFFSLVGTILGGIWADQSWGRFWGWDPKENGALLIVLWLAIILHARLAGLVKEKGLMVMAVFANIVTAFSWFGVNMLGVGLHSYGFMDQAFLWLVLFCFVELFVMWLGFAPQIFKRK